MACSIMTYRKNEGKFLTRAGTSQEFSGFKWYRVIVIKLELLPGRGNLSKPSLAFGIKPVRIHYLHKRHHQSNQKTRRLFEDLGPGSLG